MLFGRLRARAEARRRLEREYAAWLARPCVLCAATPNDVGHDCTVSVSVARVSKKARNPHWDPARRRWRLGYYHRWHDRLRGPHGRLIARCPRWHHSEDEALACGTTRLRDAQMGSFSGTDTDLAVLKAALTGTDNEHPLRGIATPRGPRPVDFTETAWLAMQARHGWACAYCGKPESAPEIEHVVPLSRGGKDVMANVVPACRGCNRSKGRMTGAEFLQLRSNRGLRSPVSDSAESPAQIPGLLLTLDEVRSFRGGVSAVAINEKVRECKLLAVPCPGRGQRGFPDWQFNEDGTVISGLAIVLLATATHPPARWQLAVWLHQPLPELAGQTPLRLISERPQDIARLAASAVGPHAGNVDWRKFRSASH